MNKNNVSLKFVECNIADIAFLLNGRQSDDCSRSVLQSIKISSTKQIRHFQESIENHLLAQLKYCKKVPVENGSYEHFQATDDIKILQEHFDLARVHRGRTDDYVVTVWSLCNALWGEQEDLDSIDATSHLTITRRKELLSEWLEAVVTNTNDQKQSNYSSHLLTLLSCHKVAEACDLAFNNNDINLAFLMAQLSGGPTTRQLMQHQLSSWQTVEADKFIALERLKAYMLVAGEPLLLSTHGVINVYENLNWLKAFAVSCYSSFSLEKIFGSI